MEETLESYRSYLFAIAYRMLGSAMDAEDMVQETYLRYQATPHDSVTSLKAWLTTILTHLCLNHLQMARRKREQYLGPWLPEPISTASSDALANVERRVDAYETISLAFLVLLEQLQPVERAVFLLREVFEYDYAEIAAFLDKSEAACRKAFSRAKHHLGEHRPRLRASLDTQKQLLTAFLQAVQEGSMSALLHLLAEEVTFWGAGAADCRACGGGALLPGNRRACVQGHVTRRRSGRAGRSQSSTGPADPLRCARLVRAHH